MDAYQKACLEHWMKEHGFSMGTLKVVRFKDNLEENPWFYRQFDAVGTIETICDAGKPIYPKQVLEVATKTFGPGVSVLW